MSDAILAVCLVVGVPLTLLALGFLIIAVKIFRGGGAEERLRLLETARRLEETLVTLETRLGALEDIMPDDRGAELDGREP